MAEFYRGFVFESNVSAPLTIEGRPVGLSGAKKVLRTRARRLSKNHIKAFARVRIHDALEARNRKRAEHLENLLGERTKWNNWRRDNQEIRPVLSYLNLSKVFGKKRKKKKLDGYDFSYTNFTQSNLSGFSLKRANFHQAILARTDLSMAHLERANFCRTDLYETDFRGAWLNGANLQGVQLAKTDLRRAHLNGCKIYGLSAWDLRLEGAEQDRLEIVYQPLWKRRKTEEVVMVDGIDVAAFIYMTLNNENIARVIDAANRQWVLLLGRFPDRTHVLARMADKLKRLHYIPIIFDFARPDQRDLAETVMLLAGMSAFVIADISDPRSTPMELQAIAPNYGVPVVPIMRGSARAFATFSGLRKFQWVLPIRRFKSVDDLIRRFHSAVIEPALAASARMTVVTRRSRR